MKIRTYLTSVLGFGVALSVLLSCGTAPASQPSDDPNAATILVLEQPTPATAQLQPGSKAIETEAVSPKATLAEESEPAPHPVEIGYKVGMQVPEFGLSLLDGSTLTSASLTDQGKPTFLYFHATW